jgi:hypothetical protein
MGMSGLQSDCAFVRDWQLIAQFGRVETEGSAIAPPDGVVVGCIVLVAEDVVDVMVEIEAEVATLWVFTVRDD